MDKIFDLLNAIYNSPHYSFGWLVAAALAIIPAIVSGNMVQHYLSMIYNKAAVNTTAFKYLLFNLIILTVSVGIIAYAFYLYVWV